MSAVRLWALRDIRRRWRSIVVLALLAAVGGGLAMAAASGALRSRTVISDAMEEHRQPDAMSIQGAQGVDWSGVIDRPYVTSWGLFGDTALCVSENGGLEGAPDSRFCSTLPLRGGWYDSIWRVDVLDGQMAARPNEMIISRTAQERFGYRVGERLHLEGIARHRPLAVPDSEGPLDDYWNSRPKGNLPWGPTYPMRVVGVYRGEEAFRLINGGVEDPHFILPTSFARAHSNELDYRVSGYFRLRGGESDVERLRHDIADQIGPDTPTTDIHDAQQRVERSTLMESVALWACALAIAAMTLVLVGQAIVRLVRGKPADADGLRALGMSRGRLACGLAAPGCLVALAGGLGAVVVAIAVSWATPIGVARSFDPEVGLRVDAPVLIAGGMGVVLAVGAIAAAVAWLAAGGAQNVREGRGAAIRPAWLPVAIGCGVSWALGGGRRRSAHASVRPALVAAVAGVAAVVSAFVVYDGIDDALAEPARAGKVWDVLVQMPEIDARADSILRSDPDVVAGSGVRCAFVPLDGRSVRTCFARPAGRPLEFVVTEGRLPKRSGEAAMGPATLGSLGVEVGDRIDGGAHGDLPVRIVGEAFFPNLSGRESYDEGAWVTPAGMFRADPVPDWYLAEYFVKLREGADREAFGLRMEQRGGGIDEFQTVEPAGRLNLTKVKSLPLLLVAFFGLLATGAVAHALVTTVRSRRRELAVLRALGLSAGQARRAVGAQALTVAIVGIVAGVPLGILMGQFAWRWVASEMPLVYVAPLPVAAIAGAALATIALFNIAALLPARAAVRTPPASTLRTE